MSMVSFHEASARRFAAAALGGHESEIELEGGALAGGLDAVAVHWVRATCPLTDARPGICFVAKHLQGVTAREAGVYERVLAVHAREVAPELLGIDTSPSGETRLFLELVERSDAWPWRGEPARLEVIGALAALHRTPVDAIATLLPAWDYDAELAAAAARALVDLERATRSPTLAALRPGLPWVRRLAAAAPRLRRELVAAEGRAFIHGDVHPGNVMMAHRAGAERPVFIDWGRSRIGAALEDVSSWLQSLGYWEPAAKQRHDTMLAAYLVAAGREGGVTRAVRDAYWLAAALGVLAGALSYHLWVASTSSDPAAVAAAIHAARDCLRMVRRADACARA